MTGFVANTSKIGHYWVNTYNKCVTSNLRFQSASNNLVGLLTVGVVTGNTGATIGNYLIEWHQGSTIGPIQLYSGVGSDPLIQAVHPFVSEPVEGGILYAVIRYIFINGVRYSPFAAEGQFSPDLKTCLGTITVAEMTCTNGDNGTQPRYSHTITYTTNVSPSQDAERWLKFKLTTDGSINYLGLFLTGYAVADRMEVFYVHLSDESIHIPITDWVVGGNSTTNYTSTPKVIGGGVTSLKLIVDWSETYVTGDYILIHITPRYFQPTIADTNWILSLKCFSSIDCGTPTADNKTVDINTISFTWDSVNCQYVFKHKMIAPYFPTYWYFYQISVQYLTEVVQSSFNTTTGEASLYLKRNTAWTNAYINGFYGNCYLLTTPTVITKSGATLTYSYSDVSEYNRAKVGWNNITGSTIYSQYTTDDTQLNHAQFVTIRTYIGLSCGDTVSTPQYFIHRSSTFSWDDTGKTLTISMVNFTNNYPDVACNNIHSTIDGYITTCTNFINQAPFTLTTYRGTEFAGISYFYGIATVSNQSSGITCFGASPNQYTLEACYPTSWAMQWSPAHNYQWYGEYLLRTGIEITDEGDPLNNFRVKNYMDSSGVLFTPGVIIYEKALGVQIIPALTTTTTTIIPTTTTTTT
jgi:hypothetical protein